MSAAARPARLYRWWPHPPLVSVAVGHRETHLQHVLCAVVLAAVLCLPVVRRATHIDVPWVVGLLGAHVGWLLFVTHGLIADRRFRSRAAIDVAMLGNLLINTAVCVAFPVLGGDPRSALWMFPVLYATLNGAGTDLEPSIALLMVHTLAPLVGIPFFLAHEGDTNWTFAGPVLCAVASAAGYHTCAVWSAGARELRRQHQRELEELRAKFDEQHRARLAQELHDSIGSVLGVVALYGDLIERSENRPDELRAIAAMVRDATREGLSDLRSVLAALAPASTDVSGVVSALGPIARRVAEAGGAEISIRVDGAADRKIDGPARLAVVRVFQEALHNAVRHARPSHVDVIIAARDEQVALEVTDDGVGFEPKATDGECRGLRGMRARIEELAGTFVIESAPGRGTRVRATVPLVRRETGARASSIEGSAVR